MSWLHLYKSMWDVGVLAWLYSHPPGRVIISPEVWAAQGWVGVLQILAYSEVSRGKMNVIRLNRVRWEMVAENVHVGSTESPTAQTPTSLSTSPLLIFF